MTQDRALELTTTHWPTAALHAELRRRQNAGDRPACGSSGATHAYNTTAHVFALLLILALSTAACSFPLLVRRFPSLPVPNTALFLSRHFGTGVLIATAFVHLLPTAFANLLDPCLPPFWNEEYPAMAGLIAMCSVLAVVGIEMIFASRGAGHSHEVDFEGLRGGGMEMGQAQRPAYRPSGSFARSWQVQMGVADDEVPLTQERGLYVDTPADASAVVNKPLPRTPSPGQRDEEEDDSDLDLDELDPLPEEAQPLTGAQEDRNGHPSNGHLTPRGKPTRKVSFANPPTTSTHPPSAPTPPANEQRLILQCLLLEAGILFHSIFIGIAVSVSTGPAFIVLLVAISFHQTFEGLALGSRIAAIPSFSPTSLKPWLMCLAYGCTTPAGQAIGIGVKGLYDPESELGLLMVGIVNAVSAGLLLYAGLVQLLAEDFLSERSYAELSGRRRAKACVAVVAGAMLMAIVGAFA